MGSWYETCGLSGLPITSGEDALLFILVPGLGMHDERGGFCYPSDVWTPFCPPFHGKYNDYGTIDLAKKAPAHWALTQNLLASHNLVWQDVRESKDWTPLQVEYDSDFFNHIERGWVRGTGRMGARSFIGDPGTDPTWFPVGQMLVRKDIWNHLLRTTCDSYHGRIKRAMLHKEAKEFVDYVLSQPPTNDLEATTKAWRSIDRHCEDTHILFGALYQDSSLNLSRYRIDIIDGLLEKTLSADEAKALLCEIADVAYVNRLMMHLRRAWRPQPGKGSQDVEWDLHEKFAAKVAAIAKAAQNDDI